MDVIPPRVSTASAPPSLPPGLIGEPALCVLSHWLFTTLQSGLKTACRASPNHKQDHRAPICPDARLALGKYLAPRMKS